jgi:hypothetical protein
VEKNSLMSWGAQVCVKPSDKLTLNYSNFVGTDKPDSGRLMRFYHNFYSMLQLTPAIGITAGFDIGLEEKAAGDKGLNTWYSPVGILRVMPHPAWAMAIRVEYYTDQQGVMIHSGAAKGCRLFGTSCNIDFLPEAHVALRLEGRLFNSTKSIFNNGSQMSKTNSSLTLAMAMAF